MRLALLGLLIVGVAGCGDGCVDETVETPGALLSLPSRSVPHPLEALRGAVDQARVAEEAWVKDPLLIAHHLFGSEAKTQVRSVETTGGQAKVIAINDGLSDDSVRGERYELELMRQADGSWLPSRARRSWRCWPSRGHASFSAAPCD